MAKRPLTPKQLAHIEKLKRLARERRGEVIVEEPPVPLTVTTAEDDILREIGQALLESGQSRAAQNVKLEQLDSILGTMSAEDYPVLAKHPAIQRFIDLMADRVAERNQDDPPGTVYNRGQLNEHKKIWQVRDLWRAAPDPACRHNGKSCPVCGGAGTCAETVRVEPTDTTIVTWNGIPWPFIAEMEQWVPKPHYDVWRESQRQKRAAREHADYLNRFRDDVPTDPTIVGPTSVMARARGHGRGGYRPGGGGFNPGAPEGEGEES